MWKNFYVDMANAGVHQQVIQTYANALSNPRSEAIRNTAGIYAYDFISGGGLTGAQGWYDGGVSASVPIKIYFLAHENTHGFQYGANLNQDLLLISSFYKVYE